MRAWAVLLVSSAIFLISIAVLMNYLDYLSAVKHETNRWAVIKDINGDMMAVEPTNDDVWSELVQMNQNGTRTWVGGKVERYGNKWGFRFSPDTVIVAEVVAEGLQATIEFISSDIEYWENLDWAYVSSKVVEINSQL